MKKLIQSREELWLVVAGMLLPFLLFILYVWGLSSVAYRLNKSTDTVSIDSMSPIEFNLKDAETVLRARGLLQ